MRSCILAAIRFLTWIDTTDRRLDTITQHDIDLWLTTTGAEHAYVAREFLRWARNRGLTGDVTIPPRPSDENPKIITDDERWAHLDRCLGDTTLPNDVRAAGALSLLYGLTVSRISRLRGDDLCANGDHTNLTLGQHRLRLAPAVAQLVRRCIINTDGWLFPGGHPGSHTSAGLQRKLKRHGFPDANRSRATALINLAADLPAPILADLLGLHPQTATEWARRAGADWTAYLAARSARTTAATTREA
jgi:integrase